MCFIFCPFRCMQRRASEFSSWKYDIRQCKLYSQQGNYTVCILCWWYSLWASAWCTNCLFTSIFIAYCYYSYVSFCNGKLMNLAFYRILNSVKDIPMSNKCILLMGGWFHQPSPYMRWFRPLLAGKYLQAGVWRQTYRTHFGFVDISFLHYGISWNVIGLCPSV